MLLVSGTVAIVLVLLVAGTVAWLSSEDALQRLVDYVVERSEGRLQIEGARGSLLDRAQLDRIVYRDEGTVVTVEGIALEHVPRALVGRRLHLREVTIERVRIVQGKQDDEPLSMPDSLALPIDVRIDRARIGHVAWQAGDNAGTLDGVTLAYTGDRNGHRVSDVEVRGAGGRLAGSASIGATPPFATSATLTLDLVKPHPEGRVEATLAGDLAALTVTAKSTLAGIAADARIKLAPFERQPLVEGHVDARDVDIARFDPQWPATRLDVTIDAKPAPGGFAGAAHATNAAAGPIDANRVPLASARAAFALSGVTLELRDITAVTPGGGSLTGTGSVNIDNGHNRWKLAIAGLDLERLHSSLIATRLAGRIDADVTGNVQRVRGEVAQEDLRLAFDARYEGATLHADRVLAQARGGSLEGSGRIALEGARPFSVDVKARRFDPARFGRFPAGSIDGAIVASGTASPDVAARADVTIASGSRLAGLPAQGRVQGQFARTAMRDVIADVSLGSNRAQANGALGRSADRMTVKFALQRVAELQPLLPEVVPRPLAGAVQGTATLVTLARGGRIELDVRGNGLTVGDDWAFAKLAIDVRATHAAPLAQLRIEALEDVAVDVQAVDAKTPAGRATQARFALAGTAASHTLTFAVQEGDARVEGRTVASLDHRGAALSWRGRVETLSASGLPGIARVALESPARFELGPQRVVLDAFRLVGNGAALDVERLRYVNGTIETQGRFRGLPVAPFVREAGLAERFPTDVTVGGAWNVTSQPEWRGTLQVARERGDVYIDDPTLAESSKISLGLETLALAAKLEGGRLVGDAQMRARLGGYALADFELAAAPGAVHPFTDAARVRAAIRAHLPSLAALQPWIGTSMRVQGQAIADVGVTGTLGKPQLGGQLVGYGLRVDMPAYGVNYHDGELRIASSPEGLKLEELSFKAGDGRFVASGIIGLPIEGSAQPTASRIAWRAEDFRAMNRPDRRLVVDGEGTLAFEDKRLVLRGKLTADEGNIEYRASDDTKLADDIVVVGRPRPGRPQQTAALDVPVDLDLELALGRDLRLAAEGLDARLAGRVRVTSKGGGPIVGKGVIRVVRGTYNAFGQRLDIERGRIIFDGPLNNPSLDVVALRKKLPVEAGVEIAGTVRAPLVRLVSEPPVPDNEKLAWLITGGPPGSESARESAAIAAAAAAFSGRGGKPITQQIAQRIGLDDISVARRAGEASSDPLSGQVVTLGKRITDRLYIAYEQGLTLADNAVRLEYVLSRYLTVAMFAGTNSGVALNYRRSWR